jgi:hypothetical protein
MENIAKEPLESLLDERRLVSRALRHWTELCAGQRLPRKIYIEEFMTGDDRASSALIKVGPSLEQSSFVFVGDYLLLSLEYDLDGKPVDQCPPDTLLEVTISYLPRVLSSRMSVTVDACTAVHFGVSILFRTTLLPLADDGINIDHVLCATNYRKLGKDEYMEPYTRLHFRSGRKPLLQLP